MKIVKRYIMLFKVFQSCSNGMLLVCCWYAIGMLLQLYAIYCVER
jgi:hypothetical protein